VLAVIIYTTRCRRLKCFINVMLFSVMKKCFVCMQCTLGTGVSPEHNLRRAVKHVGAHQMDLLHTVNPTPALKFPDKSEVGNQYKCYTGLTHSVEFVQYQLYITLR
jgi:hypothetical protein